MPVVRKLKLLPPKARVLKRYPDAASHQGAYTKHWYVTRPGGQWAVGVTPSDAWKQAAGAWL